MLFLLNEKLRPKSIKDEIFDGLKDDKAILY